MIDTKESLLQQAKAAVIAADGSLKEAAEYMALAAKGGAKQTEIASYIGKSKTWVSLLIKWHYAGYVGDPFHAPKVYHDKQPRAKSTSENVEFENKDRAKEPDQKPQEEELEEDEEQDVIRGSTVDEFTVKLNRSLMIAARDVEFAFNNLTYSESEELKQRIIINAHNVIKTLDKYFKPKTKPRFQVIDGEKV